MFIVAPWLSSAQDSQTRWASSDGSHPKTSRKASLAERQLCLSRDITIHHIIAFWEYTCACQPRAALRPKTAGHHTPESLLSKLYITFYYCISTKHILSSKFSSLWRWVGRADPCKFHDLREWSSGSQQYKDTKRYCCWLAFVSFHCSSRRLLLYAAYGKGLAFWCALIASQCRIHDKMGTAKTSRRELPGNRM